MRLPTGAEYQDAVQTPRLCFEEPELRAGRPEVDAHGLPVVASGNFASVYKIVGGSKPWAVKCFTRYTPDLERRYGAISQHLKATNPRFHVPFEYLPRGIRVESEWYPTVKMQWVEGLALNDYVSQRLRQGNIWILPHLAARWYELASALRGAGVAHCDLHHGNVIIENNRVKLVDYDGMFVPDLRGQRSNEKGHASYQHPGRDGSHFDEILDRFSLLVVYVALRALAVEPALWRRFDDGDNMLFRERDFLAPADSELFSELTRFSDKRVRDLAFFLQESCGRPLPAVPEIESIIKGDVKAPHVRVRYDMPGKEGQPAMYVNRSLTADRLCFTLWAAGSCFLTWFEAFYLRARLIEELLVVGAWTLVLLVLLFLRYTLLVHTARDRLELLSSILAGLEIDAQRIRGWLLSSVAEEIEVQARIGRLAHGKKELGRYRAVAYAPRERLESVSSSLSDLEMDVKRILGSIAHSLDEDNALQARIRVLVEGQRNWRGGETQELAAALKTIQRRSLDDHPRPRHLRTARIRGIGEGLKARLEAAGVVTAADVNRSRLMKVHGIGESRAAAILSWRESAESEIEPMLPKRLPAAQESEIRAEYQDGRRAMVREEAESRSRLEDLRRSRKQEEAALTRAIDSEEAASGTRLKGLRRSRARKEAALTENQAATSALRRELDTYSFGEYLRCVLYL